MTGRWQLDELDQHLVPGERYSKKIAEPSADQGKLLITQDEAFEAFPTFFPFSRRNQPMALCSVRSDDNQSNTSKGHEASRDQGWEKGSWLLAQIYMHPDLLDYGDYVGE